MPIDILALNELVGATAVIIGGLWALMRFVFEPRLKAVITRELVVTENRLTHLEERMARSEQGAEHQAEAVGRIERSVERMTQAVERVAEKVNDTAEAVARIEGGLGRAA